MQGRHDASRVKANTDTRMGIGMGTIYRRKRTNGNTPRTKRTQKSKARVSGLRGANRQHPKPRNETKPRLDSEPPVDAQTCTHWRKGLQKELGAAGKMRQRRALSMRNPTPSLALPQKESHGHRWKMRSEENSPTPVEPEVRRAGLECGGSGKKGEGMGVEREREGRERWEREEGEERAEGNEGRNGWSKRGVREEEGGEGVVDALEREREVLAQEGEEEVCWEGKEWGEEEHAQGSGGVEGPAEPTLGIKDLGPRTKEGLGQAGEERAMAG
ncbi:hypothetical protein B0H13DRAFT_1915491 [Mycena leptocephala]|nr:hypothetical protein B0H13DRAFT_1915491 [Mycena leptocephala]